MFRYGRPKTEYSNSGVALSIWDGEFYVSSSEANWVAQFPGPQPWQ